MKISIINGSPKHGKSTSELLLKYISPKICEENSLKLYQISKEPLQQEDWKEIADSEVLLFAFPLYIDSIPALLLRVLSEIENQNLLSKDTMIYCLINNGFYEGKQNHIAVRQMKHWCKASGAAWGQAIGIGAGEMLPFIKDIPLGHGPNKNLGNAIDHLAKNLLNQKSGKTILISPNWPRILWRIQSSLYVWYPKAKQNGLKRRDIKRKQTSEM